MSRGKSQIANRRSQTALWQVRVVAVAALFVFVLAARRAEAQTVPGQYIVELAGKPIAAKASAAGRRLVPVRAQQEKVAAELRRRGATVLDRVERVANALLVQVSPERIKAVALTPGVARIYPVRVMRLQLDRALQLHRVPAAWQLAGGVERPGAGIKVGIIDTGIDSGHPGFQDESLPLLPGFPKTSRAANIAFTNRKIIVARSYGDLLGDSRETAQDLEGHGTAVAMVAAGGTAAGPLATISGVAPKAYLANYKITVGVAGQTQDSIILKALDDSVADGMDVVNISFGSLLASRPSDDLLNSAVENAVAAGVLVVAAGGNGGPDPNTISSPATLPSAIAVGATWNDRIFAPPFSVQNLPPAIALPGNGPAPGASISASMIDLASIDPSGLACLPLPPGSLNGRVALILRGECTFEIKLNSARDAGALAAVIYTDAARPDPINMAVGSASLPALMVSFADGSAMKRVLVTRPGAISVMQFTLAPFAVNPSRLAGFTSLGPGPDGGIKPDLLATGVSVYTATQRTNSGSEDYDPSGFIVFSGTSFSSPMAAGAAAVLKGARPGLSSAQYRSLLVNSARPLLPFAEVDRRVLKGSGPLDPVQATGAGVLDLASALRAVSAAEPSTLSFGVGDSNPNLTRTLTLSNVGATADTFSISVARQGGGPLPIPSSTRVRLEPGASQTLAVQFASGSALAAGEYQGWIGVHAELAGTDSRVPYWYGVGSEVPSYLTFLFAVEAGAPGLVLEGAALFRVTDSAGIPVAGIQPQARVIAGTGRVIDVTSITEEIPGAFSLNVRLGLGQNIFRIIAGRLQQDVTIEGE